ncbi:hypothetical protein ABZ690_32875 [Streptomyces sp. NPDC006967]|jgi:hypothetical protein|uniref:hypothetical protein n=1 Tax=Streptomyces sp. NPDC006967 TaxID=3156906 RepID=UPI0033C12F64
MEQPLERAAAEAVAASRQSDQYALVLAAVQAAQLMQQQPQQLPACQHHHGPRQSPAVGKWVAVGVAGSVGAISLALSAIAVAVGAVAVTCCLLVLRSMWREASKTHR